jgi:fucose 4-O-acetylase-like acetyltransferase
MKQNQTVCFLRTAAIIAIVLHHSMLAFCGLPSNHSIGGAIPPISDVLSYLCKNFGLGVFTFISGYCLYYQSKKEENFIQFLRKKTNRLIVPCLFFGCVYGLFFSSYMFPAWPAIINGTHLWYLPMLFLCILFTSFHFYVKRYAGLLIVLCYCGTFFLALRTGCTTFGELCWYYPIFYVGFLSNKWNLDNLLEKKRKCVAFIGIGGGSFGDCSWFISDGLNGPSICF